MKKPWQIIKELEATDSRTEKEKILKRNWRNKDFKLGLQLALDPMRTYGIKQVDKKTGDEEWPEPNWHTVGDRTVPSGETYLTMHDFKEVLTIFYYRIYTYNHSKEVVKGMAARCETFEEWDDWYRRILLKDLRCGITEKTVNKVYGKDFIPTFGCMLAQDGTEKNEKYKEDCVVEYKLDGVRCLAVIENSACTLYSRTGKIFENFPHINEALAKERYNGLVFDGELMGKDFQLLMKKIGKKHGWKEEKIHEYLAIFDVITVDEFKAGISHTTQLERKHKLDKLMRADADLFWNKAVHTVNYDVLNLATQYDNGHLQGLGAKAKELGFEGLMVKPCNGIYESKRSDAWLKLKPFIEVSMKLKGLEEGTGKFEGTLGAIQCTGTDNGKLIKVKVGSGIRDEDREAIWNNPSKYVGRIVEIRADAITKAEDSAHYSLRFPRFKGFRGIDPGEKL